MAKEPEGVDLVGHLIQAMWRLLRKVAEAGTAAELWFRVRPARRLDCQAAVEPDQSPCRQTEARSQGLGAPVVVPVSVVETAQVAVCRVKGPALEKMEPGVDQTPMRGL